MELQARMASGLLLALGFADLAVLNLLLAPRLKEQGGRAAVVAERVVERALPAAPCPPAAPATAAVAPGAGAPEAAPVKATPDVVFELGEVQVPGSRAADLKTVAAEVREGKRLLVRGHADRLGSSAGNWTLSQRRAEAVRRVLEVYGAPADRVSVEAAGTAEPASPNDTPVGWARNRRVQLLWR